VVSVELDCGQCEVGLSSVTKHIVPTPQLIIRLIAGVLPSDS